jgi:outer membrane murein-binding lipoprotein Lpp
MIAKIFSQYLSFKRIKMIFLTFLLAIVSASSALTINCTFGTESSSDPYLPVTYACSSSKIAGIEESENITAIYGTHQSGKTNDDVLYLELSDIANLKFVPRGIERFFPNLFALNFAYNNITNLRGDELQPLQNLSWIRFGNNRHLEKIPGDLLANKPMMTTVCFFSNAVKNVSSRFIDSLATLQNVDHIDFRSNDCINQIARNSSQLTTLISNLRENCEFIELPPPPSCDDINSVICNVEEQNRKLVDQNEEMLNEVDLLGTQNIELNAKVEELNQKHLNLSSNVNILTANIDELSNLNQNMTLKIEELATENAELNQAITGIAEESAAIKLMITELLDKLNNCM